MVLENESTQNKKGGDEKREKDMLARIPLKGRTPEKGAREASENQRSLGRNKGARPTERFSFTPDLGVKRKLR